MSSTEENIDHKEEVNTVFRESEINSSATVGHVLEYLYEALPVLDMWGNLG